jgi:hypothetical protein
LILEGLMILQIQKQMNANIKLITTNNVMAVTARAENKVMRESYLAYIKDMTAILDKMQRDNQQIKVPKGPEPRVPGSPARSDQELDRPKYEHPKADLPSPTPKVIIKKVKAKPSPTPKPWWKNFLK